MQIIYSAGKPPWQVKEEYRKVNRSKEGVLIVGAGPETSEVRFMYPDFLLHIYEGKDSLLYNKAVDNDLVFKIGGLELEYIREDTNTTWRNCRAIEVSLGGWFAHKFNNDIIEIGDVCWQYSVFNNWKVLDPYGPFENAIRADVMDVDYTGLSVLSLSTFEHFSESAYGNIDKNKPIKALEKVHREAKNYLITIPIGAERSLENYLKNQNEIKYTFMVRDNKRGETNNWHQEQNDDLFYENYLHFEFELDYYGSASTICIIYSNNLHKYIGK